MSASSPTLEALPSVFEHPTPEELQWFLDGALPHRDFERIEDHISACDVCLMRMQNFGTVSPLAKMVREVVPPTRNFNPQAESSQSNYDPNQTTDHDSRPAAGMPAAEASDVPEPSREGSLATDLVAPRYDSAEFNGAATQSFSGQPRLGGTKTSPTDRQRGSTRKGQEDDNGDFEVSSSVRSSNDRINDYEILSELGHGGMGVVYKAVQKKLNRLVALKMVLAGARARSSTLLRFRAEANAVAKLDHPNIVQIYDIGEHDDLPFFSMEYVEGGALNTKLNHEPMEPRPAAELMKTIARAMHYAHTKGVVHRDLKPANILLTKTGVPKVTDFGLARQLDESEDSAGTQTGAVMGTPNYMAPEQAEGNTKHADHSADIYSMGATLYEMLTGRPPFSGPSVASILSQVRDSDPVSPAMLQPGLAKDLQTITLKCLQKLPAKRYLSAEEFAEDLARYLDGRTIIARPVSSFEKLVRWCRRKKGQAIATFSAIGLAIAFVVSLVVFNTQLSSKNAAIASQRDDLKTANVRIQDELNASQKTGDASYETMRRLRQIIIPELKRFGLARQQSDLVKILNEGMQKIDRATVEGTKGLERVRLLYLLDLAEQYTTLDSVMPGTRQERLNKAKQILDDAFALYTPIGGAPDAADLPRANYALLQTQRGNLEISLANVQAARADYEKALAICQDIVDHPRSLPDSPDYIFPANALRSLARAHLDLAVCQIQAQEPQEFVGKRLELAANAARAALEKAKTQNEKTYDGDGLKRFEEVLGQVEIARAINTVEVGLLAKKDELRDITTITIDPARAEAAIRHLKAATMADPNALRNGYLFDQFSYSRRNFTKLLYNDGYKAFVAGKIDDAQQIWGWCYSLVVPDISRAGDDATRLALERDAAKYLYALGSVQLKQKNATAAATSFAECVSIRRRVFFDAPTLSTAQPLMIAHARAGNSAEATKILDREIDSFTKQEKPTNVAGFWFQAACVYSLCAETLGGLNPDGTPKPDSELAAPLKLLRADFLKKATAAAEKVRAEKTKRADELERDPDLEYWRRRSGT